MSDDVKLGVRRGRVRAAQAPADRRRGGRPVRGAALCRGGGAGLLAVRAWTGPQCEDFLADALVRR
jgi:hypothetical protein